MGGYQTGRESQANLNDLFRVMLMTATVPVFMPETRFMEVYACYSFTKKSLRYPIITRQKRLLASAHLIGLAS